MDMKYSYDKSNNIMFVSYNGLISTTDDLKQMRELTDQIYNDVATKIWLIVNIAEYKVKNPMLVKEWQKSGKKTMDKYVIDEVMICKNPIQKAMSLLFNTIRGKKSPIFKSKEEAVEHVLKLQETVGKSKPIID